MRIEIEHGAIIADDEGGLWRVLEASDEELFLLMLTDYLRVGVPITVATVLVGILWIKFVA
jgi:hypothetical protein